MINPQKKRMMARYLRIKGKNSGKAPNTQTTPMTNLRVGFFPVLFGGLQIV